MEQFGMKKFRSKAILGDDLSVESAVRITAMREIELQQAVAVRDQARKSSLPDRTVEPFNAHARKLGRSHKVAQHQIKMRQKSWFGRATRWVAPGALFASTPVSLISPFILHDHLPSGSVFVGIILALAGVIKSACLIEDRAETEVGSWIISLPSEALPQPVLLEVEPVAQQAISVAVVTKVDTPGRRHEKVLSEYAAFECSPVAVFTRPALADIRIPETSAFHEAMEAASEARVRVESGLSVQADWTEAVGALERAWRDAQATADLAGHRSPEELRRGQNANLVRSSRLQKALALACAAEDKTRPDDQRQHALVAALKEAEGITPVPRRTQDMLALTTGS